MNMTKFINTFFYCSCLCVAVLSSSCTSVEDQQEVILPLNPQIQTNIVRFDRELQQLPADNLLTEFETLREQYPGFTKLYTEQLTGANTPELLLEELSLIQGDTSYRQLYEEVQNTLGDLSNIKPQVDQTIENYMVLFDLPPGALPQTYAFVSGFAYQAFVFDDSNKNGIGIGLDMFLGSDFPYQQIHPADPFFSQYLVRTYTEDHIPRKIAEVLIEDQLPPPGTADFLSLMIWGGKKLYLIDQLLNFVADTIVTEYTSGQLAWCRDNESEMWQFFFEHDLFYSTDLKKFGKFVSPSPSSPGMPPEAPGQTGNYMGWQIVRAFMSRYPGTTVDELIRMNDAQHILDLSKYKPRR